jgi:nitroimidazol reductase NimA-like FMN-containing flavoprotein (pyridoxamine 5'-phosphate oxidase superfamily)
MLGKLPASEIETLLKQQVVGRIGCHADALTYVVPISYAYDGVYIYGRTLEGMKVNMMRKNPEVCFQVDDMKNMANWKSVIAWGVFEELHEKEARDQALHNLVNRTLPFNSSETTHLTPQWPFPVSDLSSIEGIVFRILVKEKTGRFENNAVGEAYS